MDLALGAVFGAVFGVLAGACAFFIAYNEYKRNWSFRGSAAKMALTSAFVAFIFFFITSVALVMVFRAVAK
jgi:hypothetical protein